MEMEGVIYPRLWRR